MIDPDKPAGADRDGERTSEPRPKRDPKDKGYGESHGYPPGHGGPTSPGDAPAAPPKPSN